MFPRSIANRLLATAIAASVTAGIAGCAVNPVTGKKELSLMSQSQAIPTPTMANTNHCTEIQLAMATTATSAGTTTFTAMSRG